MTFFTLAEPRRLLVVLMLTTLAGCADSEFGMQPSRATSGEQQMAELRSTLKRNPNDSKALKQIGDMQAKSGNWSQAMGAYREALLVNQRDSEARLGYGEGQLALGDYTGALATATEVGGTSIRVQQLRSGALAGLNRLGEARQVLEAASTSAPRNLDLRSNLAIIAALSRDPQAYAIARAAAFAPDSSYAHRRNLMLVGGMSGNDAVAKQDGAQLGLDPAEIGDIIAVGRRAKTQGMRAFGVLAGA
ncbi:hypothetical protein [Paracoccus aminophilus]|uniref:Uncharacterized protein n=1 Tax=Paracoccus aminophilus JCM 7686 TaxID=1367847 RepID=S5XNG1_PARAH|nr:hypothetical protein [Paracoccus aminophilus]AGT08864.1 hypothetical protein JCM7686_1763 [Paracoccus aminophilus JCM 7686]